MQMEERIKKLRLELSSVRDCREVMTSALILGREILIWGADEKNDYLLDFAAKYQIKVAGYIDSDQSKTVQNGYPVWPPHKAPAEDRFILVGLDRLYSDVIKFLNLWNKWHLRDYLYYTKDVVTVTESSGIYSDIHGNRIEGMVTGFQVHISEGSVLLIGEGCKIDPGAEISLKGRSALFLGDHCTVEAGARIVVGLNGCGWIGSKGIIRRGSQFVCDKGTLYIGDGCSFGENTKLFIGHEGILSIQEDCMFSSDIVIQGYDAHPLYDLRRKKSLNKEKSYEVKIGRHVWIGRRCNILYGTEIGDGTVIGFGSMVRGRVPGNVSAAGNPLKINREGIAWRRIPTWPFIEEECMFEEYDFEKGEMEC